MRATQEKFVLEEAQRQEARERAEQPWNPRLFTFNSDTNEWHYKYTEYVHKTTPRLILITIQTQYRKIMCYIAKLTDSPIYIGVYVQCFFVTLYIKVTLVSIGYLH